MAHLIAEQLREKSLPLPLYACPLCAFNSAMGLVYQLGATRGCGSCGTRFTVTGQSRGTVPNAAQWRGWCGKSAQLIEQAKSDVLS